MLHSKRLSKVTKGCALNMKASLCDCRTGDLVLIDVVGKLEDGKVSLGIPMSPSLHSCCTCARKTIANNVCASPLSRVENPELFDRVPTRLPESMAAHETCIAHSDIMISCPHGLN